MPVSIRNQKVIMYWLFAEREPAAVTGIRTTPNTSPSLLLLVGSCANVVHSIPILHLPTSQLHTCRNSSVEKLFLLVFVEIWVDKASRTKKEQITLEIKIFMIQNNIYPAFHWLGLHEQSSESYFFLFFSFVWTTRKWRDKEQICWNSFIFFATPMETEKKSSEKFQFLRIQNMLWMLLFHFSAYSCL